MSTATAPSRSWLVYLLFIAFVVGVGGLIGTQVQPGVWYESLNKPPFNPPNWLFGPVWTALYVLIGIAGARIFLLAPKSGAMLAWVVQMALNFAWSPVWFGLQLIWPAFAVILGILAAILVFIVLARPIDRPASWLFVPYLAWVGFATLLNLSIGILN
jgi:benzodiazapine receptor